MRIFRDTSLKKRLVLSFAGVVIFAVLVSAVVFIVVLVSTMKKSATDQVKETYKVATTHIGDQLRGLEIYADLIASDMTFGQVLSFDSSIGISQKIEEFTRLSKADVVAFVPRPEQYVQIKNDIFTNAGNENLAEAFRGAKPIQALLSPEAQESRKGWMVFNEGLLLVAMKPVSHFGANMGVVFLGRFVNDVLAREMAAATGTDILVFDTEHLFAATLPLRNRGAQALPKQAELASRPNAQLEESYELAGKSYFSFFAPILDLGGRQVAALALEISNRTIQEARNKTVARVLLVTALVTILSAILGYYLARAISTPLQTITGSIHSIMEKGDLGIRVAGRFGGEMGILTGSFNSLLGQLQTAHEKLAASEHRMKEELKDASTVQEMLFPDRAATYGNIALASFIETSTETGGDWFGYGPSRDQSRTTVLIGDVTGHGMPAALITAIANGFFTGVQKVEDAVAQVVHQVGSDLGSEQGAAIGDVLRDQLRGTRYLNTADMLGLLNQAILRSAKGSLLMTFFASVFDSERLTLKYANAGHNRPFLLRSTNAGHSTVSVLPSEPSHRLGELSDVVFVEGTCMLARGDVVVWYTDGIIECENERGESYGKRRLTTALKRAALESPDRIVQEMIDDAFRFYGNYPRKDDITLVVGRILGT